MKTKLLFTIAGIFFLFQVFSSVPVEFNNESEMQSETQFASGSILTVKVQSQAIANNLLGDTEYRKVSVYLPPGYKQNENSNYPVIYMLADMNGTNEEWTRLAGNFTELIDQSIKSGKIKPMIIVFPDVKNKVGGGWYTNSPVTGNWEDFIVTDLVSYIDQNFRTLPFAASRGIAGKGMGGYGALKLATEHPGIFSAVYSLNALVDFETLISHEYLWKRSFITALQEKKFPTGDDFANQFLGMAVAFSPDMFNPTIGKLPKTETGEIVAAVRQQWLENDPLYMIQGNLKNLRALKAITVDCSNSDARIMLNSNYAAVLKGKNIKHSFSYFTGTDNSVLIKRMNDALLPMFSANLAHSLLDFNAKTTYTYTDVLKTQMITDGSIYIVQDERNGLKSANAGKTLKFDVKANTLYEIPLTNLNKGIYRIYGVSNSGFVGKSHDFGLNGGVPQVKICVSDSYCGSKIETCGINVNGACYTTNKDGEVCFCGDGKITICLKKDGYGILTKSATIYTDTTFHLSLVKDAYVQVIERGTGMPIFEATVIHDNVANLTANSGIAKVQNLRDGILDCRVFKSGYFTEILNMQMEQGKTAIIALTPKKVDITFILIGNQGHLADGIFKFGGINQKPDQYGRVSLTEIDARLEYSYSVDNASYEPVQGVLFPEADTTIALYLQPKDEAMLKLKSEQVLTTAGEITESDILIYPNPATNALTVQTGGYKGLNVELSDISGKLISKSIIEGTLHQINLSNLSKGVYFVTVKSDNFYHVRKIIKL
jgi:S-formylglutathione hydrolase FrmB